MPHRLKVQHKIFNSPLCRSFEDFVRVLPFRHQYAHPVAECVAGEHADRTQPAFHKAAVDRVLCIFEVELRLLLHLL